MSKSKTGSAIFLLAVCTATILQDRGQVSAQAAQPAQAEMARKLEQSCTACHGPGLIAQQRLDRNGWSRELDKMIRWGAKVAPDDKDPLAAYLARNFNSNRPLPNSFQAIPQGEGSDVFQMYCLSCHDDRLIASRKLDKAGWTGVVDQMTRYGAYLPSARRDELLDYLATHFGK